jgi:hypothetical protein
MPLDAIPTRVTWIFKIFFLACLVSLSGIVSPNHLPTIPGEVLVICVSYVLQELYQ